MALVDQLDTIDLQRVRFALAAGAPPVAVIALRDCRSTNDIAMASARAGSDLPLVVLTDEQTGGRGRQGAAWISPRGASLPLSLVSRLSRRPADLGGLPLAVGVACALALEQCGVPRVELKWPNDLLAGGAKLGGILIESRIDGDRGTLVVVGIGINLALPTAVARDLGRAVVSVADLADGYLEATPLVIALVSAVTQALGRFEAEGFRVFRDGWLARHAWQGAEVCVLRDGRTEQQGRAMGVTDDGALILATGNGPELVYAAEVSLRVVS